MKPQFLILLLSLILLGCTTESGRMLSHADSVMEEHPDSAMSILSRIDRHTLKDSELPYYALLYTQAQVKTDIPLDSDSLISIAYAKYGADTRGDRGIRSNFYTGEVFFNRQDYREAMRYYLTAYEEAKRLHNDYWHAKAAERISNIFFYVYNYDEAAEYIEKAADLYERVGRTRNNRFALGQLANIRLNKGNYEDAFTLLDSLRAQSLNEYPHDSIFIEYVKMPLIEAMVKTRRLKEIAGVLYDRPMKNLSDREIIEMAILQSQISDIDDDSEEITIGENLNALGTFAHSYEDRVHILYARYEDAKKMDNWKLAVSLVDTMLYYQNIVIEDIVKESVTTIQRDFYSRMSIRHESTSRMLKWVLVLSVIVFLLLMAAGIMFFFLKNKAHKAKLQADLEAFLSLKSSSEQVLREKESLQRLVKEIENQNDLMVNEIQALLSSKKQLEVDHNEIVEKLFKEKWATLDTLCDQYFGLHNSELNAKDLVNNIEKELKKIVSKKGLVEIVRSVDTHMEGIITELRNQCPFLKDTDVNFLALLYAGFSVRAVCMFIGIKYEYFYVKKARLKNRILSSDAPDKSLFIEKLK